jgi:peroxiredoxin
MLGKPVPDFSLASTGRSSSPASVRLSARRSQKPVLYIHPKFPFELPSDPDEAVCMQFDVMKLKNLYGKKVRGITRSRPRNRGTLALEWRGVKVPGHAQEVLNFVKAL